MVVFSRFVDAPAPAALDPSSLLPVQASSSSSLTPPAAPFDDGIDWRLEFTWEAPLPVCESGRRNQGVSSGRGRGRPRGSGTGSCMKYETVRTEPLGDGRERRYIAAWFP